MRASMSALAGALLIGTLGGACTILPIARSLPVEVDKVRRIEQLRLKLLVAGDVAAARALHADDFQLINPVGRAFSREEYLGSLAKGYLDYVEWTPGPMDVRMLRGAAVIRYRAQIQVSLGGQLRPLVPHWHTDYYEKRDGRWQVVWSQATEIK
jgi:hypothetical protein